MVHLSLMAPSKETDNKLRWETDVEGVAFMLYIPKWRVPKPWPTRILVRISDASDPPLPPQQLFGSAQGQDRPIHAIVTRKVDHSRTVRFEPEGKPNEWEIGEPYIPYELLPNSSVQRVRIEVEWDRSAGTWNEH